MAGIVSLSAVGKGSAISDQQLIPSYGTTSRKLESFSPEPQKHRIVLVALTFLDQL
jgi:hypothetical protein